MSNVHLMIPSHIYQLPDFNSKRLTADLTPLGPMCVQQDATVFTKRFNTSWLQKEHVCHQKLYQLSHWLPTLSLIDLKLHVTPFIALLFYQSITFLASNITPQPEQIRQCNRDVDCPSNESCRSGSCTSPCTNSCGQNTSCRVVNHLANCQCLSGYTGDPYVGCSMSSSPSTSEPSQQKPSDPCQPFPCGTNTVCENHRGIAKCSCAPGYQGDPYYRCYRRNDPCNPNPCGSNSVCINRNNYASCSCAQGFIGTPPHCRAECEVDQHCSYNQVCHRYRCRDPCEGACNDIPNTQCRVINRRPVCARYQTKCPSGFYGRDCSTLYERDTNKAPSKVVDDEFLSPCVPFVCGSNAECTTRPVFDHGLNQSAEVAYCQCPPGKTGNADMECYPVEEQKPYKRVVVTHEDVRHDLGSSEDLGVTENIVETSTTSTTTTTTTTTEAASSLTESSKAIKNCGTNAISILSADGKSICSCPVGYTGLASIECHALMMGMTMMNRLASDPALAEYDYFAV